VSGRSNLSFEQWMELDLEYIDRWSLGLDGIILCAPFLPFSWRAEQVKEISGRAAANFILTHPPYIPHSLKIQSDSESYT